MKVEVEEISPVVKKVQVVVPKERVKDEIEEVFTELQNTAQLKGFRKGKVPRKHLERLFKTYVMEQVIKKLLEETAKTALERKQLKPVIEPMVEPGELAEGQDFEYSMRVEIGPQVELKVYRDLDVEQKKLTVTDESVERAIQRMREQQALIRVPEEPREARDGDLVRMDLEASENGLPVPEETRQNAVLEVGVESYIPGLTAQLQGVKVDESKTIEARFPEKFEIAKLANRVIEYKVTVNEIRERILPELNDEWAKEQGEFQTIEELRQNVRQKIEEQLIHANRQNLERALLAELVKHNPLEVPPTQVTMRARELSHAMAQYLKGQQAGQEPSEEMVEVFKEQAEQDVKAGYLMNAVAEKEEIKVSDEDVEEWMEKEAEERGINLDKFKSRMADAGNREAVRTHLMEQKILDFLIDAAKIKEVVSDDQEAVEQAAAEVTAEE